MEKAKKFFEETLATDEAKKLIASEERKQTPEDVVRAYADIAAKLGADLSLKEIEEYIEEKMNKAAASGELDDDELSSLYGGASNGCYASYVDRENCWVNDGCDYINNNYTNYNCSWSNKGACAMLWEENDKKEPANTSFDISANENSTKFS